MNKQKEFSEETSKNKTCILAIGNPLRSDDGVADYVCQLLEEKNFPGICFITTQQLDIGITEELSKFDRVIFVDASLKDDAVSIQPIASGQYQPSAASHQINAGMLANLAQQLYATNTRFYICAIGAANFEMGNGLSDKTMANALIAVSLMTDWIHLNA